MAKKYKFNAKDFLSKKYLRGDYAVIPVHIEDKKDFYNKHDASCCTISTELCKYIDACVYNIPIEYKIKLNIDCPDLTKEEQEKMIAAVKTHYGLIIHDRNLDLKINAEKTTWLMLVGTLILIAVYFMGKYIDSFMTEILLIAGWFAIWEGVDNFVLDRRNIKIDKQNNKQLFNSIVEFVEEKEYITEDEV